MQKIPNRKIGKEVKLYQRKHCKSCKLFNRGCFGDAYCDKQTKPWDIACENYKKIIK